MRPSATLSRTASGQRALLALALVVLAACSGNDAASPEQSDAVFRPTTLRDAVLVGDRTAVERFITQGADVNAAEIDGTTLLMRAIHGRFPEIAKVLIDAGANVSATNRYGVSSLYLAARGTDAATARELLAAGADANTSLPEGETVLMTAAKAGNAAIVRALLGGRSGSVAIAPLAESAGAGVVTSGYGAVAATLSGPINRADPNAKEGWYGQTALMWAAAEGHAEIVRLLIAAGADIGDHSRLIDAPESSYERLEGDFVYPRIPNGRLTALHLAARAGELPAVQALIEGGADVDAVDAAGTNPVILATINRHLDVARVLLEAGADPNVADDYGRTVLFAAVEADSTARSSSIPATASESTPADIVNLALANGANPNAALVEPPPNEVLGGVANQPGDTALHGATRHGSTAIIQLLVERGADVHAKNGKGQTPLDIAMGVPNDGIPYNEAAAALLRGLSQED